MSFWVCINKLEDLNDKNLGYYLSATIRRKYIRCIAAFSIVDDLNKIRQAEFDQMLINPARHVVLIILIKR